MWTPFAIAYLSFFLIRTLSFDSTDRTQIPGLLIFGIASSHKDILGVSWSLDIELQYYLIVPLLWTLIKTLKHSGLTFPIIAALTIAGTILGWWIQLRHDVWTALSYAPSFLTGVLIWHSGFKSSRKLALFSVMAFLVTGISVWVHSDTQPLLLRDTPSPFHDDWFGMLWITLLFPLVAYNVHQHSGWLDQHFGNFSYALYITHDITHWPIIWGCRALLNPFSTVEKILVVSAIFAGALVFYLLIDYLLIDRNAEKLRQWLGRQLMNSRRQLAKPRTSASVPIHEDPI